jgi:cardiolipin synthase
MVMVWETEEIFFDGDQFYQAVLSDIENARAYITVEMYMFNDDALGKKIAAALVSAHQRGVKVQMILDGIGSYDFFNRMNPYFKKKGINVKIYNPLPLLQPFFGKLSILKKFRIFGERLWRLNRRNHRKIITIDENIMYSGSFNITVEHTRYHTSLPWKDLGIRVSGRDVKYAVLNFKRLWRIRDYYRYKKAIRKEISLHWKSSPILLNQTLLMKRYYTKIFLQRIKRARKRVWLMTPYFIPKRSLIRALGKASQRGVDVRLLISQNTDVKFFRWLQYFYYGYLLKKGVKIYQYTDSVLHAKNYIIDGFMTIGSTNLNHRSFLHDLEVDLVIQSEQNKELIKYHFLSSTQNQKRITIGSLKLRPLWDRILSRLFFLFKYWF